MKLQVFNRKISVRQLFYLSLYYGIAKHLPNSLGGKNLRYICGKHLFKKCGINVNIERGAWFGSGQDIEIGDYSGIGVNAHIPSDTVIGNYVMMGPNCYILDANHIISDTAKPMCLQGLAERKRTVIEDDVWIGRDVKMTPGRHISKGSVIAMACVLTKDFAPYSIIGGNPSRLLKSRLDS